MVTDCLAPVVTPIGVATFVTANGMSCMGRGLKFNPIECETFSTVKKDKYFRVVIRHTWKRVAREHRVFITADTLLLTPEGWQTVEAIHAAKFKHKSKHAEFLVWGYKCHCLNCKKLYIPVRPLWSTCSRMCMAKAAGKQSIVVRSFNALNVSYALLEDWLPVEDIKPIPMQDDIEGMRVNKIVGGEDIYVNGILLSCKSLQQKLV